VGGATIVTATSGAISGSSTVQVDPANLQALTVTPANGIVSLGQAQQLKVVGAFGDGSSQDVTSTVQWFSLNPDIAVVLPGGLAYTTGTGTADVSESPTSPGIVVSNAYVYATMIGPPPSNVFTWPVGTVFQFQGLTSSSGDLSELNNRPFTVVAEFNPLNPHQPCQAGQACTIEFVPPPVPPASGNYTVTGGSAQASALITATMNVVQNTVLTQVSGSTTLTVQ